MLPLLLKALTLLLSEMTLIEQVLRNAGTGAAVVLVVAVATGTTQWLEPFNHVLMYG